MHANWNDRFAHRTTQMRRSAIRELLKVTAQPDMISFAGGLPCADLFPIAEIQAATKQVLSKIRGASLQYSESEGLAALRDWLAANCFRSGLRVNRSNV